jgi:hypothetical protein
MRFNVAKRIGYIHCLPVISFTLYLVLYALKESLILFILVFVAVLFKTRLSIHLIHESDNKKIYIFFLPYVN